MRSKLLVILFRMLSGISSQLNDLAQDSTKGVEYCHNYHAHCIKHDCFPVLLLRVKAIIHKKDVLFKKDG